MPGSRLRNSSRASSGAFCNSSLLITVTMPGASFQDDFLRVAVMTISSAEIVLSSPAESLTLASESTDSSWANTAGIMTKKAAKKTIRLVARIRILLISTIEHNRFESYKYWRFRVCMSFVNRV